MSLDGTESIRISKVEPYTLYLATSLRDETDGHGNYVRLALLQQKLTYNISEGNTNTDNEVAAILACLPCPISGQARQRVPSHFGQQRPLDRSRARRARLRHQQERVEARYATLHRGDGSARLFPCQGQELDRAI